jgi:hypothetical protein
MNKITMTSSTGFQAGDVIHVALPRPAWWRLIRLWRWWRSPLRNKTFVVNEVTSTTTLTIGDDDETLER